MATDYGSDISGIDDVDAELSFVDGRRAYAEALCRRLGCVPGTMEDDPSYGYDLTLLIGDVIDQSEVERNIVEQFSFDDRTASARATVTQLQGSLEVKAFVEPVEVLGQPFILTALVSSLSVELIGIQDTQ